MINIPDMSLIVDEIGSDPSQKGDNHVSEAPYACERGTVAQNKVQHTHKYFILLSFTSLSDEQYYHKVNTLRNSKGHKYYGQREAQLFKGTECLSRGSSKESSEELLGER